VFGVYSPYFFIMANPLNSLNSLNPLFLLKCSPTQILIPFLPPYLYLWRERQMAFISSSPSQNQFQFQFIPLSPSFHPFLGPMPSRSSCSPPPPPHFLCSFGLSPCFEAIVGLLLSIGDSSFSVEPPAPLLLIRWPQRSYSQ
jgi:hypothetical protein